MNKSVQTVHDDDLGFTFLYVFYDFCLSLESQGPFVIKSK